MRVAVGTNVRGHVVRDQVTRLLRHLGHEVEELAIPQGRWADYPEIAAKVAQQVQQGTSERGVLVGRTGMGMCIVANKFAGVRAIACYDEFMAEVARRYLDVNVLCLSADLLGEELVKRIVETWLRAPFEGGRHAERIKRIFALEQSMSPSAK